MSLRLAVSAACLCGGVLLACSGGTSTAGLGEEGGLGDEGQAARTELEAALDSGEVTRISTAARAASAWQGQDPQLDRALGDALANHLLRIDEGAALLRSVEAPDDPAWRSAAADAALRADDRAWLARLLGDGISLDHAVVEQVVLQARRDPAVDTQVLVEVLSRCALLDGRPMLGRRQVDLPLPPALEEVLLRAGVSTLVVGRTALASVPTSSRDVRWQCEAAWFPADLPQEIPQPLPPRGVLVAASQGAHTLYLELDPRPEGDWVTVSSDAPLAARLVQAAVLLDERRAAGDDDDTAWAAVLDRYGPELWVPTPKPERDLPPGAP